jgi:integrase
VDEALKDAVKWKKLSYNPNQDVKLPKIQKKKAKNVYVLTDEEIDHLLQCARKLKLYPLFRMALLLGMRIGELLGLKWADIDFEQAAVTIRRTLSYMRDPDTGSHRFYVSPPKTEAGERMIRLPRDIVDLLREHRKQQEHVCAFVLGWKDLDLVFCTRSGGYIIPGSIRSRFDRLLAAAGLKHMKFHALRHNASLILRRLKIDPVVRMEMLGHTRVEMTDGVYGHTTQEMHREAAEEIRRLFKDEEKEE